MTGETRFHIAALGSAFAGDLPSWMVELGVLSHGPHFEAASRRRRTMAAGS
jgi:hypothetical protein